MGPEEPQIPQAPQLPEQPQQPASQPLPEPVQQPVQPIQQQQSPFGGGLQQPAMPAQPQVTPMAQSQPFVTQQFGTNMAAMPQMPPKSKKGLIIGLVAGGAGLLLLIAGVIVAMLLLGPPSKADYQKAYDKAGVLVTQFNDFKGASDFSSFTTSSEVKQKFGELKAGYDKSNSELAGMKALNDADVKKAFNDYKQKYDAAMPVAEAMLTSDASCGSAGTSLVSSVSKATTRQEALDTFDSAVGDCMSVLKDLSSSSNSDIASYGKALYDYLSAIRTYYGDKVDAIAKKDYSAYSKLVYPTSPKTSTLDTSSGKYDFTTAFDTLTSLLHDKANK